MKKKILFTANLDSFFTKFLMPQLKWFRENGYEVHIAAKQEGVQISDCDKIFDVCFARGFNLRENIISFKQMVHLFRNNHYDIVSCHTPFGAAITRLAAKKAKVKNTRVVYMAHGFHFYQGAPFHKYWLFYLSEKYLSKYTDEIITINMDDYEIARKKFHCAVSYVPGVGMDAQKFTFDFSEQQRLQLRESLGLHSDDFVMIYPAELLPRKRQTWLIQTLRPLFAEYENFHLLLPGMDSMSGQCQTLAQELGVSRQVHFLGFRKDIPQLLKIADVAVTSSMQEGLPVNVMEAIFVGLPVVATACRGNLDLIDVGKNGFVVAVDDAKAFRSRVLEVYRMPQEQRKCIREYDRTVIQKYLVENVLQDIVQIYLKDCE